MSSSAEPRSAHGPSVLLWVAPALLAVLVSFSVGILLIFPVSVAHYDDAYNLRFWPPRGAGYGEFWEGGGFVSIAVSLGLVALAIAAGFGLAALAGYFLARKASDQVRRMGLFLLVAAWALTFPRMAAWLHFLDVPGTPAVGSTWFPWLAVTPGQSVLPVLVFEAIPPLAVGIYSSLRPGFLGLSWPEDPGSRVDRFVRESVPRMSVGTLLGGALAASTLLGTVVVTTLFGSRESPSILPLISDHASLFGGLPLAAAGLVVVFVILVGLGLLLAAAAWALRRWLPRLLADLPRVSRRDYLASRLSTAVTAGAFVFVAVSLFAPIAVAFLFSFNSTNSLFVHLGFSSDWWVGTAERNGIFDDPVYRSTLEGALGFSALVACVALAFAMPAARKEAFLRPRLRVAARGILYAALAVPVFLLFLMVMSAPYLTSPTYPSVKLGGLSLVFALLVVNVPSAAAIAFIVATSSEGWTTGSGPRRPTEILRAIGASFLVTFGFLVSASSGAVLEYSQAAYVHGLLGRFIITPRIDAVLVVSSLVTLAVLAGAWIVQGKRETFRF